jgi:gluconate 2-dehydrogenase gamma chain
MSSAAANIGQPGEGHASPLREDERSTLEAITGRLIPTDEHGPGAIEAKVVRYIERSLATDYQQHFDLYRRGLASVDGLATSRHGKAFLALTSEQQDALLSDVEDGQAGSELSSFFELVLQHTKEGMFGDPAWGGNEDFVGWKLIGYPGPRYVWTEEEQRLDVVIEPFYASAPARPSDTEAAS